MTRIVKEPLSALLNETIDMARKNGGELVRLPWLRGCWTLGGPNVPTDGRRPEWWVSDNTVRSLINRGIATVTHTRGEAGKLPRPAVVRVKTENEMAIAPVVVELTDRRATIRLIDRSQNGFIDLQIVAGKGGAEDWSLELISIPAGVLHEVA